MRGNGRAIACGSDINPHPPSGKGGRVSFYPNQRVRFQSLTNEKHVFRGTVVRALAADRVLVDDHPTRKPRPVRAERLELDCVGSHKGRAA
jgi:hypothetical protein